MGTVTTAARAREAVTAGAEFLVSPNVSSDVARIARGAGLFLVLLFLFIRTLPMISIFEMQEFISQSEPEDKKFVTGGVDH